MDSHRFDSLVKILALLVTRRSGLGLPIAGILGMITSAQDATPRKRKKGKDKKHRKKRNKDDDTNKPNPDPPASCSGGACAQEWAGNQAEIDYCEFICRQCDGDDPRQFCLIEGNPFDPNKVAVCCDGGSECCGNHCCGDPLPPMFQCCDDQCVDTRADERHCGGCGEPCTGPDLRCCDGACVDTRTQEHCGSCIPCPSPYTCCDGSCVDTKFNHDHCGVCGAACGAGELCCHGDGRGCIDSCGGFCTC